MKKRVCAYARVSTNSRSQEHSFDFQSNYWNEKLGSNSEYEFVGLFADRGISGKQANRRPKFMQMVQLVRNKQVDLVFCKSVQRFARNTEELLQFVREFRELGVGVIFEKENINTLTNGNDLYLTIAAAIAEDDLNRYSENMKWTFKDKFKKGECNLNGRLYGYTMGKDKTPFQIVEEEASVVRRIFQLFIDGKSREAIAKILNDEDILSSMGCKWSKSTIGIILTNEKYVGDCLNQKFIGSNGKRNNGEEDMYYVENHHEPIIDRETWNRVQELTEEKKNPLLVGYQQKHYPFTGLIKCGCCGKNFRHKVSRSMYTPTMNVWYCATSKKECISVRIKDTELEALFIDAYNEFVTNKYQGDEESVIQAEIDKLQNEEWELVRLNANGWISHSNYVTEVDKIKKGISKLEEKMTDIQSRRITDTDFRPIEVFDESKVEKFILGIKIIGTLVKFEFYNGVTLTRRISGTRIYDKDKAKLLKLEEENNEI